MKRSERSGHDLRVQAAKADYRKERRRQQMRIAYRLIREYGNRARMFAAQNARIFARQARDRDARFWRQIAEFVQKEDDR